MKSKDEATISLIAAQDAFNNYQSILNDLARHNAEHATMIEKLEAIHLLVGETRVIAGAIATGQRLEELLNKPPL